MFGLGVSSCTWRSISEFLASELQCYSDISSSSKGLFCWSAFGHLQKLDISCFHDTLITQTPRLKTIFSDGFTSLHSLKLSDLARIGISLLSLIAASCPRLTTLQLYAAESLFNISHTCCWPCWQTSISLIEHSPIPARYFSGQDLAVSAT